MIMKKILSILAVLTLFTFNSVKSQDKKEISIKLSDPSKPGKLDIELFNGSMKVVGYNGTEVVVNYTGAAAGLNVSQQNNIVHILVEKPRTENLIIKVPQNCSLALKLLTAGNIQVENVNGDHEIYNINGNITMSGINGSISANTKNGNIKVEMNSVRRDAPLAFSNVMGTIDVSLPTMLKADVKMQTEFAKVHSEFDVDTKSADSKMENSTNRITGKINGGGPSVLLKSVGGSIELKKGK